MHWHVLLQVFRYENWEQLVYIEHSWACFLHRIDHSSFNMQHDMVLGYLIWLKPITIDGLTQNLGFSISPPLRSLSTCTQSKQLLFSSMWQMCVLTNWYSGVSNHWNGIWNGWWMYTEQLNHVTDALLSLGWAIPTTAWALNCRGYISKSLLYFYYCLVWYVCLSASDIMVDYIWLAKLNV